MKNLFFDVETTGKALMKEPASAPRQPRVVQLAAILADDEEIISSVSLVIQPKGFEIPAEASAIHGIQQEYAEQNGVSISTTLRLFSDLAAVADGFVAHNIAFDYLVMESEYSKLGDLSPFVPDKPRFCTMKASTNICKIRNQYGFKWPKLAEAYEFFTGSRLQDAHDALADVKACMAVYRGISNPVASLS